ncbi:MAG: OmpH family outer membrane protein [Thermoanaerobaculia bacterium]
MSRKTVHLRGAFLALTLAALAAPAAAQGQLKIAVIDTEQILLNSATGKKALAELKKVQEQKEGELRARQQEIKDLQTKAQEGRLSLSQDKLSELEKQLEDKLISARRLQDDATRDLNKRRDEVLAQIDQKVMPIINQLGKEGGYTMIFRKFESGLIFVDEAVDITQQVIQRLDGGGAAGK